ncbi:MAG: hypothetical protein Q9196_003575 [Gyalolechia fulgens]
MWTSSVGRNGLAIITTADGQESTVVVGADNNNNNVSAEVVDGKLGKDDQGYFGLPGHDLALLAPDIQAWSARGFDAQEVHTCLQSTHLHLGSSLRAMTAKAEEVDMIRQARVSFENLKFQ